MSLICDHPPEEKGCGDSISPPLSEALFCSVSLVTPRCVQILSNNIKFPVFLSLGYDRNRRMGGALQAAAVR